MLLSLCSTYNKSQPLDPSVNPTIGLRVWNRQLTLGLFFMFRNMNKSHTIKFIIFSPQRNMEYYRSSSVHQFLHTPLASKVYFSCNLPNHWPNFSHFFWSRKHTEQVLLLHITHNQSCFHSRVTKHCWSSPAGRGGTDLRFLYRDAMKKADYRK